MAREKSKKSLPPLNPEQIYQLLAQKNWSELIELLHAYYAVIPSDSSIETAFNVFKRELLSNFDEFKQDNDFESNLSKLYLLHSANFYSYSETTINIFIVELAKLHDKKGNLETAYQYARKLPQDNFCASIIEKYSQSLPKVVRHSQSQTIHVTENKNVSVINHTISLFKSQQENDFFIAVRIVFPMHIVYRNVALSTLVEFKNVEASLSADERKYFFTAVVDCVMFDQHKNYIPIYFFELDSSFHENEEQLRRDVVKDNILAAAGQTLYRIRKLSNKQGQTEFMKLVSEVVLH